MAKPSSNKVDEIKAIIDDYQTVLARLTETIEHHRGQIRTLLLKSDTLENMTANRLDRVCSGWRDELRQIEALTEREE